MANHCAICYIETVEDVELAAIVFKTVVDVEVVKNVEIEDLKVLRVLRETLAQKVHLVQEDMLDNKEIRVLLDHKEPRVMMVKQFSMEKLAHKA
jgi:hypothetical protein